MSTSFISSFSRSRSARLDRLGPVPAVSLVLALVLAACGGGSSATSTGALAPSTTTGSQSEATTPGTPSPASATVSASPSGSTTSATPTSMASPTPVAQQVQLHEEEVSFTSGPDTLYGTFARPEPSTGGRLPAALIISGSGPTDRNGSDPQLPNMKTNLNVAKALAADGVASLRYDKLGSGKTGLASHTSGQGIDFDLFLQEARAAYDLLAKRPEVDPTRLMILGHSEGGLFALVLAQQLQDSAESPHALVLAAPLGQRYLDVLRRQIQDQLNAAIAAGRISADHSATTMRELDQIISSLREQGKLPDTVIDPLLKPIFNPTNAAFLARADKYDPAEVAAQLPPALPVLILHGGKDQQVNDADIDHLLQGFQQAGNNNVERAELANADHVFKDVPGTPNPVEDYNNPDLPFSPGAIQHLRAFVERYVRGAE